MNVETYRLLEIQLSNLEDLFSWKLELSRRALEIRDDLRALIGKVVTERIRAEEAERSAD